jgi:hypothetical protein
VVVVTAPGTELARVRIAFGTGSDTTSTPSALGVQSRSTDVGGEKAVVVASSALSICPCLTTHLRIRTSVSFSFAGSLRNVSLAGLGPSSSPAELSSSTEPLLQERKPWALLCCGLLTLFMSDPPVSNVHHTWSSTASGEYLKLHDYWSERAESTR